MENSFYVIMEIMDNGVVRMRKFCEKFETLKDACDYLEKCEVCSDRQFVIEKETEDGCREIVRRRVYNPKKYSVRLYYSTFVDVEVEADSHASREEIKELAYDEIERGGADFYENLVPNDTDADIEEIND